MGKVIEDSIATGRDFLDALAARKTEIEWPDAREIKAELPPAPKFDADLLLPPVLAAYVMDESARIPCPPEFVAASLVVALGAAIG
jgi:hypothetical protein